MDVVYDITQKFDERHSELMDLVFHVSLFRRLGYTLIRTLQMFSMSYLHLNWALNDIFVLNMEMARNSLPKSYAKAALCLLQNKFMVVILNFSHLLKVNGIFYNQILNVWLVSANNSCKISALSVSVSLYIWIRIYNIE